MSLGGTITVPVMPLTDTTNWLLVSSTEKLLSTFTASGLPLSTAGVDETPRKASTVEGATT